MSDKNIVAVPDIGSDDEVTVIELLVKVGDSISEDTSLLTLESDKASMDIPSPSAGVVEAIMVNVGDKVKEGSPLLKIKADGESTTTSKVEAKKDMEPAKEEAPAVTSTPVTSGERQVKDFYVPDLGGANQVDVIEVHVSSGSEIKKDDALITLEGDKATMDIPAEASGTIKALHIKVNDKCSMGDLLVSIEVDADEKAKAPKEEKSSEKAEEKVIETPLTKPADAIKTVLSAPVAKANHKAYASPSIRRLAREFGVDLSQVSGSGQKGRITKKDVQAFVKAELSAPKGGIGLPKQPEIDFSKFGEIEVSPLNKIKRLTAENMVRSWLTVPHVTQFDEADITELENFRKSKKQQAEKEGYKLTILAFITKAVAFALKAFPAFNSSISADGSNLIYKKYINIGIAVDTPNGLVVPVVKGANLLSVSEIALEMGRLSQLARDKKLTPKDMSGGSFTISSLGGIGGTAFTPIVNAPEVAILGLSKASMSPVYQDGAFIPRLMLPLSLSYDHRVIDGAEAARFTRHLGLLLTDIRNLLI